MNGEVGCRWKVVGGRNAVQHSLFVPGSTKKTVLEFLQLQPTPSAEALAKAGLLTTYNIPSHDLARRSIISR